MKLEKLITSLGVGAIDIATDFYPEIAGMDTKLVYRGLVVGFGIIDNYFLKFLPSDISETLVLAGLPLLERTIYEKVSEMMGGTKTTKTRVIKYRREVPPPTVRRLEIIGER